MISVSIRMSSIAKTVIIQPGVSLWGSFGIRLGSWLSLGAPLSIVAQMMSIVPRITQMMAIAQTIISVSIRTSSIAKSVIIQPGVSLWVSLGISLSSGLGLSLLYGLDSLLLSGGRDQTVGKDSVSAGDGGTLIVLAANRGSGVDKGCVVDGVWVTTIHQRSVVETRGVDKPGFGLSLSSSIGGNS